MSFQKILAEQAFRGVNNAPNDNLEEVMQRRLTRRQMLVETALASSAVLFTGCIAKPGRHSGAQPGRHGGLGFQSIALSKEDDVILPPGYDYQVLLRWGDPILPGAARLNIESQTKRAQEHQFGYNCDFIACFPLPLGDSSNPRRAMLAVNHEYTDPVLMFPGYKTSEPTSVQVDVELAAHGLSLVEIRRRANDRWECARNSHLNRRITGETVCVMTGPAAGHPLLRTKEDPQGKWVRGTLNNCAGGKTPWGTVLTCEENFHQYFAHLTKLPDGPVKEAHTRYGLPPGESLRRWENVHSRFDLAKEPNEPFRFGWVVEIDPYDPTFMPRKRTALGRFKHEGAATVLAKDGRVVVYSGDDERFDYIYKFVSARAMDRSNREANFELLDEGTLYAAKFNDDGTGSWLPLVHGHGPLTAANGFASQAEVLINTRRAADLLGATKMDRPEDIEASPRTGKIYSVMTNNNKRTESQVNRANPRANNVHGHIIEQSEGNNDHTSTWFTWEMLIRCGDPEAPTHDAYFQDFDGDVSAIASPDNLAFDSGGNCWIATDGLQAALPRGNDGIFATALEGSERGRVRQFMSAPRGAEVCGPEFNADCTTLFASIQHPGEGSKSMAAPDLLSVWPDGGVPKPSVIAITKIAGNPRIGA